MAELTSLCVFCGARSGANPDLVTAARALGTAIGASGRTLVFGGGRVGLMGELARATQEAGGHVAGFIPEHLERIEVADKALPELHIVPDMHTRKLGMFERADAFCVLPGGLGTLDETFEIMTWRQLGLHDKPIALLNIGGYWDPLLALVDRIIADGFAGESSRRLFTVVDTTDAVLPTLAAELAGRAEGNGVPPERGARALG
ncbi:TIGR00730 family Rossman fold protein [Roseospira navarrensis]|uniref:Cytokinin riboside 5'-monophosphate phosphoribohydrolase n=1 Tax=Roseospira navarrensis TaxID=140058 RepID=A0A7X1ZAG1_9PROT|nr:TIGR00730 family Rossman fold protein [Roseospira navarrensis]MQX34925.1 TIGR00730 family Rossman fold protein [Roseospira navarrensis]